MGIFFAPWQWKYVQLQYPGIIYLTNKDKNCAIYKEDKEPDFYTTSAEWKGTLFPDEIGHWRYRWPQTPIYNSNYIQHPP